MATGEPGGPPLIRRFFPGGNTGEGFFSYYEHLWQPLEVPEFQRIWMIKGGPGVGKSTFMARIAQEVGQRGFAVEYHHCSADPDSLDGVVFPQLGVALLDATAPHVLDPRYPGAVDDVIHLGEFWDEAGIRRHKPAIVALTREYKSCYAAAYRYLAAALQVHDDWRAATADALDWGAVHDVTWRLIRDATTGRAPGKRPGRRRRLFASAITPKGFRHHLSSVAGHLPRRFILTGDEGAGSSHLVSRLADALQEHGYDVEVFYCALRPREPEHLAVPQLGWAVMTSEEPHRWEDLSDSRPTNDPPVSQEVIDFSAWRRPLSPLEQTRMQDAGEAFRGLMERAVAWLAKAKALHDELETYYIPHMDFDGIERRRRQLLTKILEERHP